MIHDVSVASVNALISPIFEWGNQGTLKGIAIEKGGNESDWNPKTTIITLIFFHLVEKLQFLTTGTTCF